VSIFPHGKARLAKHTIEGTRSQIFIQRSNRHSLSKKTLIFSPDALKGDATCESCQELARDPETLSMTSRTAKSDPNVTMIEAVVNREGSVVLFLFR